MADICPFVQILDAPVPQKVEQLADFFKGLDSHVPVQVIEVPKISQDIIPYRSVDRLPQIAEQLLEVPTVLSFASLQQQTAKQIIDIPVPRRRGGSGSGGLQGVLQGQNPAAVVVQNVDIPVPRGAFDDLHTDPWSAASSAVLRDEAFQGFFGTFPRVKESARFAGSASARVHAHSSSWTLAACEAAELVRREARRQETQRHADEALERVRLLLDKGKMKRKKKRKKRLPRSSPLPRRFCSRVLAPRFWQSQFVLVMHVRRLRHACSLGLRDNSGGDWRRFIVSVMVGLDPKDSYALCWFCWCRYTSRCVPLCGRQDQDAPRHGQHAPEGRAMFPFCR